MSQLFQTFKIREINNGILNFPNASPMKDINSDNAASFANNRSCLLYTSDAADE